MIAPSPASNNIQWFNQPLNGRRYIEEKLVLSLENFEDLIRYWNVKPTAGLMVLPNEAGDFYLDLLVRKTIVEVAYIMKDGCEMDWPIGIRSNSIH